MAATSQHKDPNTPHLIILSGLSGSGKTVALRALEDLGFYCVDNLPCRFLSNYVRDSLRESDNAIKLAVGVDIRSRVEDLQALEAEIHQLKQHPLQVEILFLHATNRVLLQRFSESRRPHPLHAQGLSLEQALKEERQRLEPVTALATHFIDTSELSVHELRRQLWQRLGHSRPGLSILLESFGFKHGVPADVDFLFDVRCLPNPHWDAALRPLTGQDTAIRDFLGGQSIVVEMHHEILQFILKQIPRFQKTERSYLTIGVGCTGGRHRSVFMVEQLARALEQHHGSILVHHRELAFDSD